MPQQQRDEHDSGIAERLSAALLDPPRTGLVLLLGSAVLVGQATRWIVARAREAGEEQLTRLNGIGARDDATTQEAEPHESSA